MPRYIIEVIRLRDDNEYRKDRKEENKQLYNLAN